MKKLIWFALAIFASRSAASAEDFHIVIQQGQRPKMAIPDFRGSGAAQGFMGSFNQTLWSDIEGAGLFEMVAKTSYPTTVPQQPSDFRQPAAVPTPRARKRDEIAAPPTGGGLWMTDW